MSFPSYRIVGLSLDQLAVGIRRLLAEGFDPLGGMLGPRGIDVDVAKLLGVSENAANLDGFTIDNADDLDGSGVTLVCDRGREQGEDVMQATRS